MNLEICKYVDSLCMYNLVFLTIIRQDIFENLKRLI